MDAALTPIASATNATKTTLGALAKNHRTLVVDFWTTTCPACPKALSKLHVYAGAHTDNTVKCISVYLGRTPENAKIVVEEGDWTAVEHFYAGEQAREAIINTWNFDRVPYLVILEDDVTKYAGSAKPLHELLVSI